MDALSSRMTPPSTHVRYRLWLLVLLSTAFASHAAVQGSTVSDRVFVGFSTDRAQVQPGERVKLSWATSNATMCEASGGWEGQRSTQGFEHSTAIERPTAFRLTCSSETASTTRTLNAVSYTHLPLPTTPYV